MTDKFDSPTDTYNPARMLIERDRLNAEIAALAAERTALRERLFKATKDLKRMAKAWREYAAGHYCSTYNREMAHGLNNAANDLEKYINQLATGERE